MLDAEILADVYLAMTGGQTRLSLDGSDGASQGGEMAAEAIRRLDGQRPGLKVVRASDQELQRHRDKLAAIADSNGETTLWDRQKEESPLH